MAMERREMTESAALVLTEWIHTLARDLNKLQAPPSPRQVAEAAVHRCPESAADVAGAVSAVETAKLLRPEIPIRNGVEAVLRLEQALPEGLNEMQKRGYFSLLLIGFGGGTQELDRAGGAELRRRLGCLLEDRANRLLAHMVELAGFGAVGLEPAAPECLEGILRGQHLPILTAAVFCTAAEGLLDRSWQWPAAVGISLAAGERLVSQCAPEGNDFSRFLEVQESLYGAALLAVTTLCLRVFFTSGGELEEMQKILTSPEECSDVLAQQMYGLLGHISGYCTEQAELVLQQLSGALCAYGVYCGAAEASRVWQPAPAEIPAERIAGEPEREENRASNR